MSPARFHTLRSVCTIVTPEFSYVVCTYPGPPSRVHYQYISTPPVYSYSLDLILLLPCHSTPVLPQPHLAPRALCARHTHLGLRSLLTSDPPELQRSSGCLTLDPSDSSRNSFHPCLASVPVTGPANVHQTGSQPACRTRHLILPLTARSDSGRSYVRDRNP